jgi:hypothetical protein
MSNLVCKLGWDFLRIGFGRFESCFNRWDQLGFDRVYQFNQLGFGKCSVVIHILLKFNCGTITSEDIDIIEIRKGYIVEPIVEIGYTNF